MKRELGSRALASFTDQALASLTNFVVLFFALRTLSIDGVGTFTWIYTAILTVLVLVRPLALEPLLIKFSSGNEDFRRRAAGQALGFSLAVGLSGVIVGIIASLLPLGVGLLGLVLPAALLVLLLQDAWRFYFLASGKPWAAALNDAFCLACTFIAMLVVLALAEPSVSLLIVVWTAGTFGGVVLGWSQTSILPRPSQSKVWMTSNRGLGLHFAGEVALEHIAIQLAITAIGILSGTLALGQIGAARTIMTPITTLTGCLIMFMVPEMARLRSAGDLRRMSRFAASASMLSVLTVGIFTLAVILIPTEVGLSIVGNNWNLAFPLLLPIGIWTAAASARHAPRATLRAMQRSTTSLRLAIFTGPLLVGATAAGAVLDGSMGAAWAIALSYCISFSLWSLFAWQAVRHPERSEVRGGT